MPILTELIVDKRATVAVITTQRIAGRHTERHIDRTRPSAIASIYSDMQRGFLHVISNATVTEAYYQIDGPDQKELTWNI